MSPIRSFIPALCLSALPASALAGDHHGAGHHQAEEHEAAVRAAVMDYFEGGNAGDGERVASAFETEVGDMFIRRTGEDGTDRVSAMNLGEFASRFTAPIPFERQGEILEIRIVDDMMAFAHFSFTTPDRQFDDFFVLYRVNEAWRIVSKAYTVEPLQE